MLVHSDRRTGQPGRPVVVAGVADRIWYPLWDDGVRLDHAVRTVPEARAAAAADLRTALSLLDARHLAGDPSLTTELRASVLADWRGSARTRLPGLHDSVRARAERFGELAHAQAGDLKEARGGLRDLVVLQALVASWLVDVPHRRVDAARTTLLDVRDALHAATGRATDRLGVEDQPDVAAALGLPGRTELLRTVAAAARAVALVSDVAWRRVDRLLAPDAAGQAARRRGTRPGPRLTPLADGVASHDGEVVLTGDATPARDPELALRVAAVAARTGDPVGPATADRLAREAAVPTVPWPASARDRLVDALGAGPGLVGVWDAYDEAGLLERLMPVWSEIRCLPSDSPVHRWTVDRHSVGAVVEASRLVRRVDRPDLLLLTALVHDLGKGASAASGADHSVAGQPLAVGVARDLGLGPGDAELVGLLVRHHLLLPELATTRDVADPATAAAVAAVLPDGAALDLLAALTEADARATGPAAWSPWRARLVGSLVEAVRARMTGTRAVSAQTPAVPDRVAALGVDPSRPAVVATGSEGDTHRLTTVGPDRPGLLATTAGVLALDRLVVRAATVASADGTAVVDWVLTRSAAEPPDPARLRAQLVRALDGSLDPGARLAARDPGPAAGVPGASGGAGAGTGPVGVRVLRDASATATVLEVRATDRPGLLFSVCAALTAAGAVVRSAHLATHGSEVVDVFYLHGRGGAPVDAAGAEQVRAAVEAALAGTGGDAADLR